MTTRSGTLGFKPFLKRKASSKLTGDEPAPTRRTRLGNDLTDEQHSAHEAAKASTDGRLITSRRARTHSDATLQQFSIQPA